MKALLASQQNWSVDLKVTHQRGKLNWTIVVSQSLVATPQAGLVGHSDGLERQEG